MAGWTQPLWACAVCFGDPNSSEVQGINIGIVLLIVLCGGVLGAIGAFFFYLFKRSKMLIISHPEDLGIRLIRGSENVHD